ncbi:MAG: hypothetical protein EON58_02755 [Alphaproteobacteria bacterium]|nr:MAG: hypothetical protein EON58_02755 [Alphaproteobacteria bacterium]
MPRYFFTVQGDPEPDREGNEIPDLALAKCEAVKMAGHLICDAASTFWDTQQFTMSVTNEAGLTLFTLEFLGLEAPSIMNWPGSTR